MQEIESSVLGSCVRERNVKHKVTRHSHPAVARGRCCLSSQRMGLCENAQSYFMVSFKQRGRGTVWVAEHGLTDCLGKLWRAGELFRWAVMTTATPQVTGVLWISDGGAELKGCSHCDRHVVVEWTLISLPNHNPVWFGFVVFTQHSTGSKD